MRLLSILTLIVFAVGCGQPAAPPAAAKPVSAKPERLAVEHLPNAYRLHTKVISGGLPAGEDGFAQLEKLGVKTVISVDGAKPDVETARRHGLRYVHLPHGYDGIPEERAKELARAVRDLPGPIYIHCHHGHHRSPAAAAVACVAAGLIAPEAAVTVLETAGTSKNYRGLYASAQSAKKLDAALLDELQADFPETAAIPPLAEAMVAIEHTHDHLKSLAANGWQRLPKQPDLDSAHEALLLREHYTELLRTDEAQREPAEFQQLLKEGETAAQQLEDLLHAWQGAGSDEPPAAAREVLERISANCKTCHQRFRDIPLSEKQKP